MLDDFESVEEKAFTGESSKLILSHLRQYFPEIQHFSQLRPIQSRSTFYAWHTAARDASIWQQSLNQLAVEQLNANQSSWFNGIITTVRMGEIAAALPPTLVQLQTGLNKCNALITEYQELQHLSQQTQQGFFQFHPSFIQLIISASFAKLCIKKFQGEINSNQEVFDAQQAAQTPLPALSDTSEGLFDAMVDVLAEEMITLSSSP